VGFEIGDIFHIVHTCPDVDAATAWYQRHLGGIEASPKTYLDIEKRWAVFVDLGGIVLEPMSVLPLDEGQRPTPMQRFAQNFGYRWHSLACYVDGLPDLYARLRAAGVRMFKTGGGPVADGPLSPDAGAVWTHPRDTFGLIEFAGVHPLRHERGGDPTPAEQLGIRGLACITLLPRDISAAHSLYEDVLGGVIVGERRWEWYGTESIFLRLGRSAVVELAQPIGDGGRAAADMASGGDVLHAVTLRVESVDRLAEHLAASGVNVARNGPDLVIDAEAATGALLRFTEQPAWS
jgi:catechol 2,3-dioxygenase-like lactoylglutathione lyase family enzyme